jgi:Helix-turn-helix domain
VSDDIGASVNEWVNVVRRARLGSSAKLIALVIASYANPDGTHVYPGVARLAVQTELDYRTVRRALGKLRNAGLLQVTKRGARKAGQSDEYRLTLAPDLLDNIAVPTPDEEKEAIQSVREKHRRSTGHLRPVETEKEAEPYRTGVTRINGSTGQPMRFVQDTGDPPPSIPTSTVFDPPSLNGDLRYGGTGSRGPGSSQERQQREVDQDQNRPGEPRCMNCGSAITHLRRAQTLDRLHAPICVRCEHAGEYDGDPCIPDKVCA